MKIEITLQKEDWRRFQAYTARKLRKRQKSWMDRWWANLLFGICVGIVFMAIINFFDKLHWPTAVSVALLFSLLYAYFIFIMIRVKKRYEPLESGIFCGKHAFTFSSAGISSRGKGYEGFQSWEIIKEIERTSGMILIYLDKAYAYVFPEEKLADADQFYQYISEQYSRVTSGTR